MTGRKGTSLIEVLIYTAIFGLLFTLIYQFFNLGVSYFTAARASIEVQGGLQSAAHRLARELAESNLATIRFYGSPSVPYGVVFASPRYMSTHATTPNRLVFDIDSGKPLWHKYICYFIEADPANQKYCRLIRKEKDLPGSGWSLTPTASSDTTLTFKNNNGLPVEMLAANLKATGFNIYSVEGAPTTVSNPITINFQLESLSKGKNNTLDSQLYVNVFN